MYKPITLYIGLRYIYGRGLDRFDRFVSWFSTSAITVGVMALVIVLSVMNGFERELESNILSLMPQVILTTPEGRLDPKLPLEVPEEFQGIMHVASLTIGDVVLQSAKNVAVGIMLGINPTDPEPLANYFIDANMNQLVPGEYGIILGEKLARQLAVKRADQLRLMVPGASHFTPMGRIASQRLFTLVGTYSANSEVDGYQFLVNQDDASRLMRYPPGHVTGWRLWLQEPLRVDCFSKKLLPKGLIWKDWRERKGALFQAVRIEKNMMGLLLSLIIVLTVFNITTSLGLLVVEKEGEIAILQTQGLTRGQVILVFMAHGGSAGIIGTFLGIGLGVLLVSRLNWLLLAPICTFLDSAMLPVKIEYIQISTIALLTISISLLSTLYPSWCAAAIHPSEALRYER